MSERYEQSNLFINNITLSNNYNNIYERQLEEYYYSIKCKNHKNCNGYLPDRWLEVRGRYLCIPCERFKQ
jgi:hypothetical protein